MFIVCTFLPKQIPRLCKLSWPINPFLILINMGVISVTPGMYMSTQESQLVVPHERNQGIRVVVDLTQGLSGHNVMCDIIFTLYNLGQELLKPKLTNRDP